MIQDDTYEFIGQWDDQFKAVGYESDIEGRPIERLIRCKECRFNYGIANGEGFNADDILCTYFETDGMTANDYCSQAERKEHD